MNDRPPKRSFSFGAFRLDTEEKLLWQGESNVALPPKVLDVLCILVKAEGRIVSKSEIMDTVWAGSFVEEGNLTQSIYTLRRTLGTDEENKQIVETIPRRGFRIAIPVSAEVERPEKAGIRKTEIPDASPPASSPFSSRYRILLASALALGVILIPVLAYNYFKTPSNTASPIENVSFQKLTSSGNISTPTISPDGKSIAFVRENDLYLQDINNGTSAKLNVLNHTIFNNLRFSRDGEKLYFRNEKRTDAGGDVFEVSRFGGESRKILEDSWSSIAVSPDGKSLSFVRYFPNDAKWALFIRSLDSGEEKILFERSSPDSIYRTGFPAWSPDSKKILVVAQEKPASAIYVIDIDSGKTEKQETPRLIQIEQTVWNSQGNAIFLVGREKDRFFQLWKLSYPGGDIQRITNDLSIYRHISLSDDGKMLIAENQLIFAHLWTTTMDNLQDQKQITSGNINRDGTAGITWTPDGNLIYTSRQVGDVDIWGLRFPDSSFDQLTKNAGQNNEYPSVSADGRFIYFESNRVNSRHIWRIDIDGNNPTQITFSEKDNEVFPAVSMDGNWLYFIKKSSRGNVIIRQNLQDKRFENITQQGVFSPDSFVRPSPDGKLLAFNNIKQPGNTDSNDKVSEIGIVYLQEQNRVEIFRFPRIGSSLSWTPDSKSFDYFENTREGAKIWRRTLDETAEPRLLLSIPKSHLFHFAWSLDGKNLALAIGKHERDVILLKNFN